MPLFQLLIQLGPLVLLLWASPAASVLIDSGNGSGNTSAPASDPGWSHVGVRGGSTAVYLESGWLLTASHVGAGGVWLGGTYYPAVPGSAVQLSNPDQSPADLLLFAISPYPALAPLAVAASPPEMGDPLIFVGNGHDRGPSVSWGGYGGYQWASPRTLRWGTNEVEVFPPTKILGNWAFGSRFESGASAHEAQAANGDSGGAAFAWTGSAWELAGLIYAVSQHGGQPGDVSLYQQITYAADLSVYRSQIDDVVGLPEPAGALPAGWVLLAVLRARARRRQPFHQLRLRRRSTPWRSVPCAPSGYDTSMSSRP